MPKPTTVNIQSFLLWQFEQFLGARIFNASKRLCDINFKISHYEIQVCFRLMLVKLERLSNKRELEKN